jgi:hypothetical protein
LATSPAKSSLKPSLLGRSLGARRWLLADPREVVEVHSDGRHAGTAGAAGGLEPGLKRQRVRIQRSRLPALLRRHVLVALLLAIPLEALALAGVLPQAVVVAAPALLYIVTVIWALRRRPSLPTVAQFLDDRLGLFDRLGTGLELERRGAGNGAGTPLERRTVAEAVSLVDAGAGEWRSRPAKAPREWGAVGVAVAVLAALVAIAVIPSSSSSAGEAEEGATALGGDGPGAAAKEHELNKKGLEQYLGAKSGPAQIKKGLATKGNIRPAAAQGGKAAGNRAPGETYVTPAEGVPKGAQQGFHFSDESLDEGPVGVHASGKSQGGTPSESKSGESQGGKTGGGKSAGGEGKGPGGGGAGPGKMGGGQDASQTPQGGQQGAQANPGTKTPAPAPASKAAGAQPGSSQESPETGSPGGNTAGNGAGGNRTGKSRENEGIKSKGLKLQAGYAPFHSAKGGESKGKTGLREGGGGKARTGTAEGEVEGNGTFAFVPATGGASPSGAGAGQGLAQSYLEALTFLEKLAW